MSKAKPRKSRAKSAQKSAPKSTPGATPAEASKSPSVPAEVKDFRSHFFLPDERFRWCQETQERIAEEFIAREPPKGGSRAPEGSSSANQALSEEYLELVIRRFCPDRLSVREVAGILSRVPASESGESLMDVLRSESSIPTVLETFDGYVDEVHDEVAFVTLISEHGEPLEGEYAAKELLAKGIGEGSRFRCRTVKSGDAVTVEIEPLADIVLTQEEVDASNNEVDEFLAGADIDGDD